MKKWIVIGVISLLVVMNGYLVISQMSVGYQSLTPWSSYQVLTAAQLNSQFALLNAGEDSLLSAIGDSSHAVRSAFPPLSSFSDSANAAIARNTSKLNVVDFDDSSNARTLTTVPLWWTWAYADSIDSNDSLTIEIKNQTPLGTTSGLYVKNTTGLSEKVNLILSFVLPSERASLDSIRFLTWTETTGATNYALATVFDDSLQSGWKALATATSDTLRSATARTARYQGLTGINIKGGAVRLKVLIQTIADSLFIATPWAYYTMK